AQLRTSTYNSCLIFLYADTQLPLHSSLFSSTLLLPPTVTPFPYTTLFRSTVSSRAKQRISGAASDFDRGSAARHPPRTARRSRQIGKHTSELQSPYDLVCRLLLEKKKKNKQNR